MHIIQPNRKNCNSFSEFYVLNYGQISPNYDNQGQFSPVYQSVFL